jgi:hypothetical protein
MGGKKRRGKEPGAAAGRERQIWVTGGDRDRACDSLAGAALYASREAGVPISEWEVLAAVKLGFSLCGMRFGYTRPEHNREVRPPLLRRDQLEEGVRRMY